MATVRDKGYHHWAGQLEEFRFPWWPITRNGIRLSFQRKYFKFLFAFSYLPAVVFLIGIYVSEKAEDFRFMVRGADTFLAIDPKYFRAYFTADFVLFMLVMLLVFAGAGLIADDMRHNALQLYFSRPLRKRSYLLGKASVVFAFVLALTLLPGLILLIMKLIFSASFALLAQYPWLPLSILACSALYAVFFASYTLLLSALSRNRRYVTILIFAVYFFSDILHGIFYGAFRNPYFALLSIKANLKQVGSAIFGQTPPFAFPWPLSLLVLGGVCGLAALVLSRRVREVEVVR